MDKDIDAVAVCTPDHMHYPVCAWAISKGKHVFCEKPLTRTIWEASDLARMTADANVITQMGNQGHTNEGWRLIKEWADAGIIGEVEDVYIWTDRPIWPQGELKVPAGQPVPKTLDYNLWRGVAPYQPYNGSFIPFAWRGLRNYGTGAAGDMACHFMDVPYSAFELGFPVSVTANSTPFNSYSWPAEASSTMLFNSRYGKGGKITIECEAEEDVLHIRISDEGKGIEDIAQAIEPFFTTAEEEERSGMGFTIMQTFMNGFKVESQKGVGTTVAMTKKFGGNKETEVKAHAQ